MYTNLTRGGRVFCAGVMVMVEKGVGTSLGRELGLGRVARGFLSHADEGAPGRLVQERAVGEVHLVEDFPPLVHGRGACAEIKFRPTQRRVCSMVWRSNLTHCLISTQRLAFRRVGLDLCEESPHLSRDRLNLDGRGALFALQRLVHVLRGQGGLLLLRGELGRGWSHHSGAWHVSRSVRRVTEVMWDRPGVDRPVSRDFSRMRSRRCRSRLSTSAKLRHKSTKACTRVFGSSGAHPLTEEIEKALQEAGAALRETPSA